MTENPKPEQVELSDDEKFQLETLKGNLGTVNSRLRASLGTVLILFLFVLLLVVSDSKEIEVPIIKIKADSIKAQQMTL